jgi:RNA polymerase sigma factor (sigma-70 family)
MTAPATVLTDRLDVFVAFVRRRIGDPELAADIVQDALAKALAHRDDLDDEERLLPWFWRILRNTMHDAQARHAGAVHLPEDLPAQDTATAAICACLGQAIADLPERSRQAMQRVDLEGEDAAQVATALGITVNHLKVLRHRARADLRGRLATICRTCAVHGCVDCTCPPRTAPAAHQP